MLQRSKLQTRPLQGSVLQAGQSDGVLLNELEEHRAALQFLTSSNFDGPLADLFECLLSIEATQSELIQLGYVFN